VFATALDCARLVRDGQLSPVEAAEESLRRIDAWQAETNAFSQLRPEETLAEARTLGDGLARGREPGPLCGVPVAIKDLFDVAGWETTGCCAGYRGRVADRDAEVVRRLRDAGAVVVGKTNQHELAAGGTNLVSACGPTSNPWDRARLTGGSSGGSGAAVASRCVPLALGTDTGGSIRIPASLCGISGLKPTHGRVSLDGVMPLAPSMDTVGPMATTVDDVALAFGVLTGRPVEPPRSARLRVGAVSVFVAPGRPDVMAAVEAVIDALREEGAAFEPVGDLRYEPDDWGRLAWRELYEAHGHLLERPDAVERPTREFMEQGRAITPDELEAARRRVAALRADFAAMLERADVLVVPATAFPAPLAGEIEVDVGGGRTLNVRRGAISLLTRPVNLAGLPAVAFPAGFSGEGLPLGVQVIGRPGEEATLLGIGKAWQDRTSYHPEEPSL
jgi:Asp-tRNA(Asn)/Glu-tRNA(Gln) amidotransferase A subunit family amidase